MRRGGFTKGLIAGTVIGSAIGMMLEKPDPRAMMRLRRKTTRAVKNLGCAVEELVTGR